MENKKIYRKDIINSQRCDNMPKLYHQIAELIEFDFIDLTTYDEDFWLNMYPKYNNVLHKVLAKASQDKIIDRKNTYKKMSGNYIITFD